MVSPNILLFRFSQNILSNLKNLFHDNMTLDDLNQKIRVVVWFFLLFHILAVTAFSPTRLPTPFYIFCISFWLCYFHILRVCKNELLKGIPFILVNISLAYVFLQKGENYYLRLITISLPSLPLYAVQGFPPFLIFVLGGGYYCLHKGFSFYMELFYEPITSTYRIPAHSLDHVFTGYRFALGIEVFCLTIYLVVVQNLWKRYSRAKANLEESNKKLELANKELEEANRQLQAADQLAKHADQLDMLNKQLQSALQSQDLFVACVSHELRNPLNVMLGNLDLLEQQVKDANQMQLLKGCKLYGDTLLNLINNLLDVAKINSDKVEINEHETDMSSFLDELWTGIRAGIEEKGLKGVLLVDKRMPLWLLIDSHRLRQIIINLINNAVKFTSKGSVKIMFSLASKSNLSSFSDLPDPVPPEDRSFKESEELRDLDSDDDLLEGDRQEAYQSKVPHTRNNFLYFEHNEPVKSRLEQSLNSGNHYSYETLKIDIVDTGCGVSQEIQKYLFRPFVQGDRSITREFGGTGLGLFIVKQLLMKMGGEIKMTSMRGSGTRFEVFLPIKPLKKQLWGSREHIEFCPSVNTYEESKTFASPVSNSSRNVLIVDDDPFNQTLLKQFFKRFGFKIDVAGNGLEGLMMYQKKQGNYSLITMDIQMPTMDGITACKKIREFEKETQKKRVPVAIITANCSEDEVKICQDNDTIEPAYFFRKPFRLSDCKFCVERITSSC